VATDTGYAWIVPSDDTFDCIVLNNANYGDFTTGYQQFVFTAKDDDLKCDETVSLVRSDHSTNPGEIVDF